MPGKRAVDQTRISISAPKKMVEYMRDLCEREDITVSQYIRRLVREDQAEYMADGKREKKQ